MKKFIFLIISILILISSFLPIATSEDLFVNITHIGGIAYLLYAVPLLAMALSVLFVYRPDTQHLKIWFSLVGILGLLLGAVVLNSGMNHLNAFIEMQYEMDARSSSFDHAIAKFDEDFNKSMNGFGNHNMTNIQEPQTPKQQAEPEQNPVKLPTASIGAGALLFLIGNIALIACSFLIIRKTA